jgi:hypothetical protein
MSKPKPHDKHRQCKLRKGNQLMWSWLPSKYAKVGKVLDLKDDGEWERGWTVEEVWGEARSLDVLARADLWRHHRDGTDARRDGEDGWVTPTSPGR